jgi:F-type H+-transporting ATPase subunit gamma
MAALKDIKRKVSAVQKTKQITKAMNMVAASKFKNALHRMEDYRPYAAKFLRVLNGLALRVESSAHPLLAVREGGRVNAICMTSDRGLCAGFNTNMIKYVERFAREKTREGKTVKLLPVGRKGRDYFRRKADIAGEYVDVFGKFSMDLAGKIAGGLIDSFLAGEYDELYLIYNRFANVSVQRPAIIRILPVSSLEEDEEAPDHEHTVEYLYEPSAPELLDKLLPLYVRVQIYQALLETSAGENGARMVAMDNATRNCEEMIQSLTLKYNKARQAAITAELMDIVGGTEALSKG